MPRRHGPVKGASPASARDGLRRAEHASPSQRATRSGRERLCWLESPWKTKDPNYKIDSLGVGDAACKIKKCFRALSYGCLPALVEYKLYFQKKKIHKEPCNSIIYTTTSTPKGYESLWQYMTPNKAAVAVTCGRGPNNPSRSRRCVAGSRAKASKFSRAKRTSPPSKQSL
jgi:hypothetical protein